MSYKGKVQKVRVCDAKDGYTILASHFDGQNRSREVVDQRFLMRRVRQLDGKRCLDIGCGTGRILTLLKKRRCAFIEGIDVAPGMVELVTKKGGYDKVTCADVRGGFTNEYGQYDLIIMNYLLKHIADKDVGPLMMDLYGMLKEGGQVIIIHEPRRHARRQEVPDDLAVKVDTFHHAANTVLERMAEAGFVELEEEELGSEEKGNYALGVVAKKPH